MGGVMIYYKNDLAIKHRTDLQLHINTIVVEITISRKKDFLYLPIGNSAKLLMILTFFKKKLMKC